MVRLAIPNKPKAKQLVKKVIKKQPAKPQIKHKNKPKSTVQVKKIQARKPAAKQTKKIKSKKSVKAKKTQVRRMTKIVKQKQLNKKINKEQTVKQKIPKQKIIKQKVTRVIKPVEDQKEVRVTKKQAGVVKPPHVPNPFKFYSLEQYDTFRATMKTLDQTKSIPEIKNILKINGQTMSGNKSEISNKVADGQILGQIPRCPNCFGGRPKFDQSQGVYHCVGYRDDDAFVWCRKSYTFAELPRRPWIYGD